MDKQTNKDIKDFVTGTKYGLYALMVVVVIVLLVAVFRVITGTF
ncbi:MAG: hypothetical protein Q7R49_00855 [Candidatus Daviesbacteria bacterium]|nr:hypothetical protein [Candidatus Daviesbacteria bacterium]